MPANDSHHLILQLEADASLHEPHRLRSRLDALDWLDSCFGESGENVPAGESDIPAMYARARAIRGRLETANAALYQEIRLEIQRGAQVNPGTNQLPNSLLDWLQKVSGPTQDGLPFPGLGYDYQDELLSGVLALREPAQAKAPAEPEMVFYQPTPVRHILRLIAMSKLSEADTPVNLLIDIGSGLGHVPLLASILTGAPTLGIEVEPAYVASARECAQSLRLERVTFVQQDARTADLSTGTVFHLYTPFTGAMLAQVLEKLRNESTSRPIRICTLGPCTEQLAAQSWLKPAAPPDPDQITLFQSHI
jgi:hypothetical protein